MTQEENAYPARHVYKDAAAAEVYDVRREQGWRSRKLKALELGAVRKVATGLPKEYKAMELPCGTGRSFLPLIEHFSSVTGVDVADEMLDVARGRYADCPGATFLQADGTALPFEDNQFDSSFSVRLFGHTPPDVRVAILKEMARVTRDVVAVMLYVRGPLITIRKKLQWTIRPPKGPWYPIRNMSGVRELMSSVGLKIVKINSLMPGVMESRFVVAKKA